MTRLLFVLMAFSLIFLRAIAAPANPSTNVQQPWAHPGWPACIAAFKADYKAKKDVISYKFIDGKCGELKAEMQALPQGSCFMAINSPIEFLNRDFGIYLGCIGNKAVTSAWEEVCTTHQGHYNPEIEAAMRNDPRCKGFPNLLAQKRTKENNTFSKKDLTAIAKHRQTGRYEDLPNAVRYANDNKDPYCRKLIDKVRKLENHPQFDTNKSIRVKWADEATFAANAGCKL